MNVRLCERVLGNLLNSRDAFSLLRREQDRLEIRWWELDKRALRKTTLSGQSIRILLPPGHFLNEGDVLSDDGATLIVLTVAECEVLVVNPRDFDEMGRIALEIGNLHAPAQINNNELLIAPDGPVEAVLNRLGVSYGRELRKFHPVRCAGMPAWQFADDYKILA